MSGVKPMMSWIATIAGQPFAGAAPSGRHSRARMAPPFERGTRSSVSTATARRYHAPALNFDRPGADTRAMARWALVLLFVALVVYHLWSGRAIARPAGVLAPAEPVQENLSDGPHWQVGAYDVHALARFALDARVLSAERYRFGRESDLAPIDLALGWGPMSANEVLDQLSISQSGRFYFWQSPAPGPLPPGQ